MKILASLIFLLAATNLSALSVGNGPNPTINGLSDHFTVIEHPSKRGATVLEAPVSQDGVNLYIAIDSDSFASADRPGNGGIRMLNYQSTKHAIDDAVRLAKGMTRKHDMFR